MVKEMGREPLFGQPGEMREKKKSPAEKMSELRDAAHKNAVLEAQRAEQARAENPTKQFARRTNSGNTEKPKDPFERFMAERNDKEVDAMSQDAAAISKAEANIRESVTLKTKGVELEGDEEGNAILIDDVEEGNTRAEAERRVLEAERANRHEDIQWTKEARDRQMAELEAQDRRALEQAKERLDEVVAKAEQDNDVEQKAG